MPARDEFTAHCLELLAVVGAPRARRMFGGQGLYVDELFVALILGDRLYLKADALTRPQFEAAGCVPFAYVAKTGPMTMSYFSAPDDSMESPVLMQPWARLAIAAALRAKAAKAPAAARKVPANARTGKG